MYLPFALKNNEPVSINDVIQGIACSCICPSCKSKLVAVKGEKKAHHFRHYKNPECKHGYETALHLAAKKILESSKRITLPRLYFKHHILIEKKDIKIETVYLEKNINAFRPDLIIEHDSTRTLIEIAVTHFIDTEKLEKIKKHNLSTIEINLSQLSKYDIDFDYLRNLLTKQVDYKLWIHHSKYDMLCAKKKSELENKDFVNNPTKVKKSISIEHQEMELAKFRKKIHSSPHYKLEKTHPCIHNCPLKKKSLNISYNSDPFYYAELESDCKSCLFFNGKDPSEKFIYCLCTT